MRYSALALALLMAAGCRPAFEGYTTDGPDIVDRATGEPVQLIGFGLGGWLLPEGYMWGIRTLNRPRQFEAAIEDLIGPADAAEFWRLYHENYVTEEDWRAMKAMGVNSVRIPLLASRLLPREQTGGPPFEFSDEGFRFLDSVVTWAGRFHMGVIWDMHGAPGAQNAENISDSDGEARLWTEPEIYWPRLDALWLEIARRYAGNPWIIGYDLLNEPLLVRYDGIDEADLRTLYVHLTETIRTVDPHGIIFVEGDDWAQNFDMLEPLDWDPHLVLAFHSYPPVATPASLARWDTLRTRYGIPLWHGETGEVGPPYQRNGESSIMMRAENVSWSWWTHKKMASRTQPWHCPPTEGFQRILDYWQGRAERPMPDDAREWLYDQAHRLNSRYCVFLPDMVASLEGLDPGGWLSIREHEAPKIQAATLDVAAEVGRAAQLEVRATGFPLEYTWLRGDRVIETGATPTVSFVPRSTEESGDWRVIVSNELGADTSRTARLVVEPFAGYEVPRSDRSPELRALDRLMVGAEAPASDDLSARWALWWNDSGLHGRVEVTDPVLRNGHAIDHDNDGIELYLDLDNTKWVSYTGDDAYIRLVRQGPVSATEGTLPEGFEMTQTEVNGGYTVSFSIPLPAPVREGGFIGIDLHVNDSDSDRREHKIGWASSRDIAWRRPSAFGTAQLVPTAQ